MSRRHTALLCSWCLAFLSACGGSGGSDGGSSIPVPGTSAGTSRQVVDVSGVTMTLNGSSWLSKGVVLQAFVRPLAALQADPSQSGILNARNHFGPTELASIHNYQADTICFQIGQPALDAASPLYDPSYLGQVVGAIKAARQAGFVVMIMMQDEAISGDPSLCRASVPARFVRRVAMGCRVRRCKHARAGMGRRVVGADGPSSWAWQSQ